MDDNDNCNCMKKNMKNEEEGKKKRRKLETTTPFKNNPALNKEYKSSC